MKYILLLFVLSASALPTCLTAQKAEKAAIKAVINRFFEGMEKHDTTILLSTCTASPMLQTFRANKNGDMIVVSEPFSKFVEAVGRPTTDKYKEVITFKNIMAEQALASVWTPYTFYVNDKVSHCGTNSFQMVKTKDGWKIQYIIDTRRRDCDKK